jgi:NifU-like protein involved in Fe-S cluster formation
MTAPLYNTQILRLAATIPHQRRLPDPMGSSEKRSPICGSRVTVDINVDRDGRVRDVGLLVNACALGQASASLLGEAVIGTSAGEIAGARDALTAWLAGEGEVPDWPGFALFEPALPHSARHASIRLGFEAAAEAAQAAAAKAPA